MTSVDDLLREVKARKLFVTNCYEGTDKLWRCYLRDRSNGMPHVAFGQGNTMAAAIQAALKPKFEDLL